MQPYEYTLSNGLRTIYSFDPHKASFTSALVMKAGAFYENEDEPRGLAHFTEHLCFDGTKHIPDKEKLVELIDDVGGDWNGYTSNQSVTYYAHTLAEDFERSLTFVSEIAVNPLLEDTWFNHEKSIISEEIHGYDSDPWQKVFREQNMRCSHDSRLIYDVIGTVESVHTIRLEDIRAFHTRNYCAHNAVLGCAGSIPFERVKEVIEKCFGSMSSGTLREDPEFSILDPHGALSILWPTAEHAHLSLAYHGYKTSDVRSPALALGLGIFGGGASSRLFRSIREKEGLCYMVNSSSNSYQTFGSSSVMSGLSPKNIPSFVDSYIRERDAFLRSGPTLEEFQREKKSALTSLLFKTDSTFGMATHYAGAALFRPDMYHLDDLARRIEEVTIDDIMNATYEILSDKPYIVVASKDEIDTTLFNSLV